MRYNVEFRKSKLDNYFSDMPIGVSGESRGGAGGLGPPPLEMLKV